MKEVIKKIGLGIASVAMVACGMTAIAPSVYASPVTEAQGGVSDITPAGTNTDLMDIIKTILNTVFVVVGKYQLVIVDIDGVHESINDFFSTSKISI